MADDRPVKPDFHWLVRDITRAAVGYGFSLKEDDTTPGQPIAHEDLSSELPAVLNYTFAEWLKEIQTVWNVSYFENDWRRYLLGKKPIGLFSAHYCLSKLLSDTDQRLREGVCTEENARALSIAIKQELVKELGRHKGLNMARMREIDQILRSDLKVTQVVAAERLGCTPQWIRKLAKQGKLEKLSSGSITSKSLLKLLAKRGEST